MISFIGSVTNGDNLEPSQISKALSLPIITSNQGEEIRDLGNSGGPRMVWGKTGEKVTFFY